MKKQQNLFQKCGCRSFGRCVCVRVGVARSFFWRIDRNLQN